LAVVALVTGAVIIICYLFMMVGSSGNVSQSIEDITDGGSCSSMASSSSARDCKWQRDYNTPSYDRSKSALSCCCIDGYGSRADCYINGLPRKRSMCNKCGPLYSDYPF
jgi:hypothetical protein